MHRDSYPLALHKKRIKIREIFILREKKIFYSINQLNNT